MPKNVKYLTNFYHRNCSKTKRNVINFNNLKSLKLSIFFNYVLKLIILKLFQMLNVCEKIF